MEQKGNEFLKQILSECRLDHIAIAVEDMAQSKKIYSDMGLVFDEGEEVVESQGVRTAFATIDEGGAHLELLLPHGEAGPIHQYIAKKGPGLHHICFSVADILSKCEELKQKGYRLLNDEPVEGANNCLVNFIHPKSAGGVLIELSQKRC